MTDPVAPTPTPAPAATPTPAAPTAPLTLDVTPTPAPAVPVTPPAPVPEPQGNVEVVYEPTGDAGLDMALGFIGKQGLAGDHPAVVAAAAGDFTLLKATLAQKGVVGYEAFIELGQQAYGRTQEKQKAQAEAARTAIHTQVGGAENWNAIQAWASANADADEKTVINAQLGAGGVAAKMAVAYLANAYNKANNKEQDPATVLAPGGAGKPPSASSGMLSPSEYAKEVALLSVKLRGRVDGSPEYEALRRRVKL